MKTAGVLFTLILFSNFAYADTLFLKNGRDIEGIIISEDNETVELEVSSGSVRFSKNEITSILRASTNEISSLRRSWDKQKIQLQEKLAKQQFDEDARPRSVSFSHDPQGIVLNVLLDGKVEAKMVLDTGASVMLITSGIAKKLKINLNNVKPDMRVQVADGRVINAKRILIDRVKVEGVEARNVEGAVLLDEIKSPNFIDGLLGMSFLKNYNFKVNYKEKKLTLEKY